MSEVLAAQPLEAEQALFNWEHRAYEDAATWGAEALEGNIRTTFRYRFDGKELYAEDGGALLPIFEDALQDAKRIISKHPNLQFELRRRNAELNEYKDMVAMASGREPNTMVTVSDFPPELMEHPHDVGGYNVSRKQTMLRVITREPDGSLIMRSQSLDLSDRKALEAIYNYLGRTPEAGELLGQRIKLQLHSLEQDVLIDRLTGVYDQSLQRQYGNEWYAGRLDARRHNTYDFVRAQHDLLHAVVQARLSGGSVQELYYNLAAALEKRRRPVFIKPDVLQQIPTDSQMLLMEEMVVAGRQAKVEGKQYSGCGATLRPEGGAPSVNNELNDSGFGNKTEESTKYSFDKKMHCVVCQAPPKEGEPKKMCGPCGICRSCDTKLKK